MKKILLLAVVFTHAAYGSQHSKYKKLPDNGDQHEVMAIPLPEKKENDYGLPETATWSRMLAYIAAQKEKERLKEKERFPIELCGP